MTRIDTALSSTTSLIVASILALAGGCAELTEEIGSIAQADFEFGDECTNISNCGANSAQINGYSISELDTYPELGEDEMARGWLEKPEQRMANASGIKFLRFENPYGEPYDVWIEDGELVASSDGLTQIRGDRLIDFRFVLSISNPQTQLEVPEMDLVITSFGEVASWVDPGIHSGAVPQLLAYGLAYDPNYDSLPNGPIEPNELSSLCPGQSPTDSTVFLFAGEIYDTEERVVFSESAPGAYPHISDWISLACAGSAAAKMKLLCYGPQADCNGSGQVASPDARQALLKAITADYCGIGHSFTADGTSIWWQDIYGTADNNHAPGSLEAVFDSNGATCLSDTELRVHDYDYVASICGIHTPPRCNDPNVDPYGGAWHWETRLAHPNP